ncbi:MAG TPA: hypothetical protein VME18_12815, partial [Acidobacteriaceae bacterium]|nr:hypothetical protein [Acidobacteriaceae bacterium]
MIDGDTEFEQALFAAFAREAAPETLIVAVEERLREPAFVPSFASLRVATQSRWTSLWSLAAHALVVALLLLFALSQWRTRLIQQKTAAMVDVTPFIPAAPMKETMGGGGGGGNHEIVEASKGKLPKMAKTQITPP